MLISLCHLVELSESGKQESFSGTLQGPKGFYNLYETIGSGAFGEVRVSKIDSGELFAVKLFYVDHPAFNKTSIETAREELKNAQTFDHPNLVKYFDYDEGAFLKQDGEPQYECAYLVGELVTGGELFFYIAE